MSGNGDGDSSGPRLVRLQNSGEPSGSKLTWTSVGGRSLGAVEGTNVVRVPFGVRRPRRVRPERPEHWATLVLPFQTVGGDPTPPPQAA